MNNNINKSSSPTPQQQPTAMLSSSNNSTPPPPSSTQQQPTLKDHVIQSKREGNDNAPTFNTSNNNNTTDNNNPVSLQREGGSNNKMDEGGNNKNRVSNPTNTVRRRTSVLEAASTLASLFSTTGALPSSRPPSASFNNNEQTNKSIDKVNLKAPSSAIPTYRPSALAAPTLTHNYTNNNNSLLGAQQQQGRVVEERGWGSEDYEQIGNTKIRVLDAPHTVTGVYGNRNSLLNNLVASRGGAAARGGSYEELNKHLGNLNKQLGEYANNYNHRGELMNNYGGSGSPPTRHQVGSSNNLLLMSENSLLGLEGMARVRGGRDVLTGIRPPPSLNGNQQGQHQSLVGTARVGGGMGYNVMERDDNKEEEEVMDDEGNIINAPPGNDVPLTFPQKLMEVLSHPQVNDTIAWLPHGRGFIILQKRKFSLEVMPNYFKHSKFTSFTRKLNRWGFTRVSRGPEMGAYYHKLFQRGNYYMCTQMTCNSSNKSAAAKKEGEEAADGTTTKKKKKKKSGPTAQSRVYAPMSQPPPKAPPPMIELLDDEDMNRNGQRSSGVDSSDDSHMSSHRMPSSLPFAGSHHQSMNDRGGDLSTASRNDFITRQQELDRLQRYMNQRNASSSGFDRAFSRHQAAMNHQHQSTNPQFSVSNLHNRRSPPMMQQSTGMSQSSSSSMQNRLRELEMMQHQLRQANQGRSTNESMSAKLLNLSAANSSSRHHPEVIAHAMNALKSRDNQALLASLMTTNEHTKAADDKDMMVPQGHNAALQTQPPMHRQFQEYNSNNQDDRNMSLPSSAINYHRGGDNSQGKDYATLLNQMKQIERLSQQTRPSDMSMMSSAAGNGSREIKISSLINQMTQSEVANLYREISARQQQRRQHQQQSSSGGGETLTGGETSQSSTIHAPSGEYSRSVRRASAA